MLSYSYSCLAQSVERMTVNHDATGSSPVTGASEKPLTIRFKGFFLLLQNRLKYCLWDRKFLREMGFKRVIRWKHNGLLIEICKKMVQVCAGISHWTRIIIFCESRIKLKFIMNALYTKVESIHFRYPKSKL